MYRAYFNLNENPFAISPDPRYLYLSERHREGLTHLLYGMGEGGGFVQLTGEVGTGKTLLYRSVLERVPEQVDVALIINPKQSAQELIANICDELRVIYPYGSHSVKALNQHLLRAHAEGRRTVLIIDEAQDLEVDVLEQIRLLTNLETNRQKLLQIILVGQPELKTLLALPELRQLAQRITARYDLTPLNIEETAAYIQHRLKTAGATRPIFTPGAMKTIHRLSGGVPRLINTIAERSLLGAYAEQKQEVDSAMARRAAAEVKGERGHRRPLWFALAAAASLLVAGFAFWHFTGAFRSSPPVAAVDGAPTDKRISQVADLTTQKPAPTNTHEEKALADFSPESLPPPAATTPTGKDSPPFPQLLTSGALQTDSATAFTTLFRYWKEDYGELPGQTACDRATAAGLRCIFGRGTWNNLKLFNRPAVVELIDPLGRRHHLTVSHMDEGMVTFDVGGVPYRVSRETLEPLWFGAYLLLWRPPPLQHSVLRKGMKGSDVVWLRNILNKALKTPDPNPERTVYDDVLAARVQRFQSTHGLPADGVAGRQTLIALNGAVADPSTPLLQRPKVLDRRWLGRAPKP